MVLRPAGAAFLLVAVSSSATAQELRPRPVPDYRVTSYTFESPSMGVRFAVNVGAPPGLPARPGRKYPALITTDGDWAFRGVHEAASALSGAIDTLFVVSIGTALEDGDSTWTRRRVYEFSPPDWPKQDAFGKLVAGMCGAYGTRPDRCTGGAPALLRAIISELVPLVAARYPIDTAQLGLFGISAGGFFASWAIFQDGVPFRKYLISSPAMAYGDGDIFRQEERYAGAHKDLPVAIYFGSGGLEIQDGMLEGIGSITSGMTHLAGKLAGRNYPGLRLTTEIHPGMGHTDVMGTVVTRGLRVLYGH